MTQVVEILPDVKEVLVYIMGANVPSGARSLVIMNHDIDHIGTEQVGPRTLRFKHRKKNGFLKSYPHVNVTSRALRNICFKSLMS